MIKARPKIAFEGDINDHVISYMTDRYFEQDSLLFKKCLELSELHLTSENFGAQKNLSITLAAPVVELSVIDTYTSPEEKLNCFCTTFDLIFAELKSAMATIISKYSNKDNDIPVVDNSDVLPALMAVIIKSKLSHLYTNLEIVGSYIRSHSDEIDEQTRSIFKIFNCATEKIVSLSEDNLKKDAEKELHSLGLLEVMHLSMSNTDLTDNSQLDEKEATDLLLQEQKDRIVDLITTCTTANVP